MNSDEKNLPEQLRKLSDDMIDIAISLHDLGTKEAIDHARELIKAATIAIMWSHEVEKIVNRK